MWPRRKYLIFVHCVHNSGAIYTNLRIIYHLYFYLLYLPYTVFLNFNLLASMQWVNGK